MRKIVLLAVFVLSAVLQPVFGTSLEQLVGNERAAALRAVPAGTTQPIIEVQLRSPVPRLMPSYRELQLLVTESITRLEPSLFVETLSLYRKPSSQASAWSNAQRAGIFNQLTALSTLTGIQYYSASRNAMRTFYEISQVVDNPTNKRPLPDPVFSTPPASLTLYARQKDLIFGENIYRFDYRTNANVIIFMQENETPMNAGIIPAIGRNRFRTVMAVIDTEDSLLIYAAAMARAASIPGMGDRISTSFTNRVNAVLTWFTGRADRVFL